MSFKAVDRQRLFVGGSWVEPDGGYYAVVDPASEETVGWAPEASRDQVRAACAAAREAFGPWSRTSPEERAAVLGRAADIIRGHLVPYAELAQAETGATTGTARGMQVGVGAARFRRYARVEPAEWAIPPQINEAGGGTSHAFKAVGAGKAGVMGALAVRQPVGVVTCITSYNNPWANPAGKIAPALAMGNTVVVKPAPQDPLSVYRMAEALQAAGAPPGVVNVVSGRSVEVGEAAVSSPDVDMVSFTGSTAVGQRIAEVCGRDMKRQLMELGGRARRSSSTTRTWGPPWPGSGRRSPSTAGRSARRRRGCWPSGVCTTGWSSNWPPTRGASRSATPGSGTRLSAR